MINANIVADSVSPDGIRITTFELEYPRFIHSEFMTHRVFSRNAASSRAIPIKTMIDLIKNNPAIPVHWGKNKPGMQADEELQGKELEEVQALWAKARDYACQIAEEMSEKGAHKQIVNRILEPFQNIKVVMTTTEIGNFLNLRDHKDAQPEIRVLAKKIKEKYNDSKPFQLDYDEWHTPYYKNGFWTKDDKDYSLDEALMISASCCAQVSYRKLDSGIEKAKEIYKRLIESKPIHASPFEHQAKPINMNSNISRSSWNKLGITHMTADHKLWSGNFCGWIQYRQLIQASNT